MAKDKTDFLKFSAYSMKDLITRKLSERSEFTDQIYEGSNLAILIDLVSYMYQCLVYCLNNAASESMFEDTQIYENISRLINLIGYHPRGCYPSTFSAYIRSSSDKVLLPYTSIDTGLTDSRGQNIVFSTKRTNMDITGYNAVNIEEDGILPQTFYNGQWKMHPVIFTASDMDNQVFTLDGVQSDYTQEKYVANDFIDVFVFDQSGNTGEFWERDVNGLFTNSSNIKQWTTTNTSIYGTEHKVFDVKLNHDKTYEIMFGDGIIGKKPAPGSKIIVFYLDTNGPDGDIQLDEIDFTNLKLEHSPAQLGVSEDLFDKIQAALLGSDYDKAKDVVSNDYTVTPSSNYVTKFKAEESIDEIKVNAPNWYKLGNRLITRGDYEYFVKNYPQARECVGNNEIVDVKCMNNIEFVASFYKWLYIWGRRAFGDGHHYFNTAFWQRTDYKQVDPADGNNTYLWIKIGNSKQTDQLDEYNVDLANQLFNNSLQPIKTMTTEIQVVKPVIVNFDICACMDLDHVRNVYLNRNIQKTFDENCESYIEITLDDNTLYISTTIQQQIYNIIVNAFNVNTCSLGHSVEYSGILDQIYAIQGVKRVRTVFNPGNSDYTQYVVDGISFASWSPVLSEDECPGVDLDIGNTIRHLEEFQFPRFQGADMLKNRIKIIKKSLTTINTIKM